jgi:hypothetical protein
MAETERAQLPEPDAEAIETTPDVSTNGSERNEPTSQVGAVAVRFLADRVAEHVAEMRPGLEAVKEAVFESFDKSSARADLARRQRMGMLFAQTAAVETAVKEFAATLQEAAANAEPEAALRFVRMRSRLDEFARIDAEASRKLRLLASNAHEPWADEREEVSPWDGPHVPGVLFGQFLEDMVRGVAHLAESVRKRRMETRLIEALAALDAELLRQRLDLRHELDVIREEKERASERRGDEPEAGATNAGDATDPDSPRPGAPEAWQAWKEARLVAISSEATESDRLKADAAAWGALRVSGPDEVLLLAGPMSNEAEASARRFAEKAASERGLAPSRIVLAAYEKAMAESIAAEREARSGDPSGRINERRIRLRDQAREHLAEFLERRAGLGGDGMGAASTSHSLLRGISKKDAEKELLALLDEAPIERDRSLDVVATARQAHAGVVPVELVDASLEREFRRSAATRRHRRENVPRRQEIIVRHRELARSRDEWTALRARGGSVGAWAAWKAEALSRELRAGAARMMAEPEMRHYLDQMASQGGAKSVALRSGIEALALEHEAELTAEASLAPDQKLAARWMTLDLARRSAEALLADREAESILRADLIASAARDSRAIARQCRETADAITRSERIESIAADFDAAIPDEDARMSMVDRLADDAISARANFAERGRADVEALLDPGNPAIRGRTSAHAEANVNALLRDGDPVHPTMDAFAVSARDADARSRDEMRDLGVSLPEKRRMPPDARTLDTDREPRRGSDRTIDGAFVIVDPGAGRSSVAFEKAAAAEVLAAERSGRAVAKREADDLVIDHEPSREAGRPSPSPEIDGVDKRRSAEERKRESAIASAVADMVARDIRMARVHRDRQRAAAQSSDRLFGIWQGNAAAGLWNAGIRTRDKLLVIGSDVGEAIRNRDRSVGTFAGIAGSWREIEDRRAKLHLRTLEETLRRVADGKATEGDLRNLNAYARSGELRLAVERAERMEGRVPQLGKTLRLARKGEADHDLSKTMKQASSSLAEISIERFAKAMERSEAAFVGDCRTSGEFARDYVPTKEEIRLARAVASDSHAMEKLLDRKEKLDALRGVAPGKSDAELEKMHFKRGRTAREGLKAERLLALVDLAIARESRGVFRGEKGALSINERNAGRPNAPSVRESPVESKDDRWLDQARRLDTARKGMDVAGGEIRYPSVADLFKGHADRKREARDQGRGRERDVER